MLKLKLFLNFLTIVILTSCYNNNTEEIKTCKTVFIDHKYQLSRIKPILDRIINDSCQIYSLNMSNTTDLFFFNTEIDQFYDSTKFRQFTEEEERFVQSVRPKSDVTGVLYLKGVFIAFILANSKHKSLYNTYLVNIIDNKKFNYCYPNLKKYNLDFNDDEANWINKINKDWSIVCGSLIYANENKVCDYLLKKE